MSAGSRGGFDCLQDAIMSRGPMRWLRPVDELLQRDTFAHQRKLLAILLHADPGVGPTVWPRDSERAGSPAASR